VGLAKALGEARTLKGHKQEGEKLRELLDKPNFCNELGKVGRDGTSGWSSMLDAALKGLNDERRANLLEHVEPLRKLIDTASKWEVQFECQMVVTFIEGAVERVLSSPFSAVSGLYWSMLNSLCGNDTYFRLMGYEKASTLAATLISCSWDALLPGSRNGAPSDPAGARLGAAESQQQAVFAARLLCAVMLNFHFTLPIEALLATIKKFVELLGAEGNDARLPQLWMAINTMLRRQAMEHGQVVWDDFITSRPLLEFVADALRSFSLVCDGGIVLRRLPLVPLASSGTLCGPHSDRPASLKAARARVRTRCESGCCSASSSKGGYPPPPRAPPLATFSPLEVPPVASATPPTQRGGEPCHPISRVRRAAGARSSSALWRTRCTRATPRRASGVPS